jgi:uncharacterized GH25 family protein
VRTWFERASIVALVLLAESASLSPGTASAHEYWLAPSTWRCAPGDTITARVFVGTGFRGEAKPYAPKRAVRFTFEGARSIDLMPVGINGETVWARINPVDAKGAVICYASNGTFIELPAADFDRYLKLEGLGAPRAARAKLGAAAPPGRELYRRSCKAWVRGDDASRITKTYGLPLEIVPDSDPAAQARVAFRVLYEGKPLANALVRAWRQPVGAPMAAATRDSVGPSAETRTDAQGHAALNLPGAGEWILSTVHMVPAADPAEADWQSTWGSLTFARLAKSRR